MDYPDDAAVWKIDDEYMMGESILCAPFIDSASTRAVYLPKGEFYDSIWTKNKGGKAYTVSISLDEISMFIKFQKRFYGFVSASGAKKLSGFKEVLPACNLYI